MRVFCWAIFQLSFWVANGLLAGEPTQREFGFHYFGTIHVDDLDGDAEPAKSRTVRVWLPIAESSPAQDIEVVKIEVPATHRIEREANHGNAILYFEVDAKQQPEIPFAVQYQVRRREVQALSATEVQGRRAKPGNSSMYLKPNRLVPIGELALPRLVLGDAKTPLQIGRAIYDHVDELVAYDKTKPGYGRGDVQWVCDSRTGNCTDFHSLFISLARSKHIPARFKIGFPLPQERGQGDIGGYHCWAEFYSPVQGWVPVDISEADKAPEKKEYFFGNLTDNRIHFSTGRDLTLVPKQASPPLNYFIYPHVEVDGQQIEKSRIDLRFGYKDQNTAVKNVP